MLCDNLKSVGDSTLATDCYSHSKHYDSILTRLLVGDIANLLGYCTRSWS